MQLTEIKEYLFKLCTSSLFLFWSRKAMKTLVTGVVGFISSHIFDVVGVDNLNDY